MKTQTVMPSAFAVQSMIRALIQDCARLVPRELLLLDESYLLHRWKAEGDTFILTTLPKLGKAVEKALIREELLIVPPGWALKGKTRLPLFLNHLFTWVFHEDGMPRGAPRRVELQLSTDKGSWRPSDFPSSESCFALMMIRQITLLWSKVTASVEETVNDKAVLDFEERTKGEPVIEFTDYIRRARLILERIFNRDSADCEELLEFERAPWGNHGPGAVADKSSPREKWNFSTWPGVDLSLFMINPRLRCEAKPISTQPYARVTCVPKDFRGPRIICVEPKENQFAQQGLMGCLYRLLMRHTLTKKSIRFDDTTESERLCFRRDVGTIDLKDASDNLSLVLGRMILPKWIFRLATRFRTRSVTYKNRLWSPRCLATMGNACCFPLETVIFWALAQSVVSLRANRGISSVRGPVRVYGDDIIAPIGAIPEIIRVLTGAGLKVNEDKTCQRNLVKESCGEFVYAGASQRIVKIKTRSVLDIHSWLQFKDYSVQARKIGLVNLSETMVTLMKELIAPSSVKRRFNKKLQRLEWRSPTLANVAKSEQLSDGPGLYAWFVRNEVAPLLSGTVVKVKWRWQSDDPYQGLS